MTERKGTALVAASSAFVVTLFYVNHWGVEINPDTISYLGAEVPVDDFRMPVYPLFLDLLGENLAVATVIQGILFVVAALEVYVLTLLLTQRVGLALVAGLLVGCNPWILSFVKPAIAEGLALFWVTTLALMVVLCLRKPRPLWLWLTALVLALAIFTRPDWAYAPILVFALLARPGIRWHALAAACSVYALVVVYVIANATLNDYRGLTEVEQINAFSKVLQYRLHENAPERYAELTRTIDEWFAAGGRADPFELDKAHPELREDHHALAGEYARAAILASPGRYLAESAKLIVQPQQPYAFYDQAGDSELIRDGPFAVPLILFAGFGWLGMGLLSLFPLTCAFCLATWILHRDWRSYAMLALAVIAFYDFALVMAASYGDYGRINTANTPLRLLVTTTTIMLAVAAVRSIRATGTEAQPSPQSRSRLRVAGRG